MSKSTVKSSKKTASKKSVVVKSYKLSELKALSSAEIHSFSDKQKAQIMQLCKLNSSARRTLSSMMKTERMISMRKYIAEAKSTMNMLKAKMIAEFDYCCAASTIKTECADSCNTQYAHSKQVYVAEQKDRNSVVHFIATKLAVAKAEHQKNKSSNRIHLDTKRYTFRGFSLYKCLLCGY